MSLPDPSPARKPSRFWLYAPYVLLAVAAALWSIFWVWEKRQVVNRMDAAAERAKGAGYEIAWASREIGGYPFRLDVTLTDARISEPSGWALRAPRIEAEAQAFAPTSWLIAATKGLTVVRPVGGPVNVSGERIRASLTHPGARPPSLSFEGVKLAFATPLEAARPFWLVGADRVEFHLRAGPDDEGGVFLSLAGGKARPSSLFARLAGEKPVSGEWNSTLSKMSVFTGRDWPDAVRRWSAGGGKMTVRNGNLTAGDALIAVNSGTLAAGADGRLSGALNVSLRQAPAALAAMGEFGLLPPETAAAASLVARARQGEGDAARAALTFQAGQATLGPIAVGPAPKVYTPRAP